MIVPQSFVLHTIVAVGILAVGIPFGGSTHFAVLVSNYDVLFACGFGDQFKSHIGEPSHVGFAAFAHLDELQVATDHLVVSCVAITILHHLSILTDGKVTNGFISMQIPFSRLGFYHFVGAIRQRTVFRFCNPVHHLNGSAHFAGGVKGTIHIYSIFALVGDFKKSAVQGSPAQGCQKAGFKVTFFDQHVPSDNLIGTVKLIDNSIILNQDGLVGHRVQHGIIGGTFVQDVLTVGEKIIGGAGFTLTVSDQGFDHFAGLIFLPLHHDGVAGIVDNLEGNTFKISVALGSAAGNGVQLFQRDAAPLHFIYSGDRHGMTILPYLDSFTGPGQKHRFICPDFLHLVCAIRKRIIAGAGSSRLVRGNGHHHVAYSVGLAIHNHGIGAAVNNLKVNPSERRVALGRAAHLTILFSDGDAAPYHIIFSLILQHLAVLRDGHRDFFREGQQHGVVSRNLSNGVIAIGEGICTGSGNATGIGGDRHSHLPWLGRGTVHHNSVLGFVDNLKRYPCQTGVALGGSPGLAVFLLDGQAAFFNIFGDVIWNQFIGIPNQLAAINVVGMYGGVQAITGRRRNFLNRYRTKGNIVYHRERAICI